MNKLITDITGKFPFVLDDLRWAHNGIISAIAELLKSFGDRVILHGVEVDTETGSYTQGAFYIKGEVFAFDAQSIPSEANKVVRIVESYDAAGLKEFPDRAEGDRLKNTYLVQKVEIVGYETLPSPLPVGEYELSSFTVMQTVIDEIAVLRTEMNTANSDIDSLQSNVSTLQTNVSTNTSNIATNTSNISSNTSDITAVETTANNNASTLAEGLSGQNICTVPKVGGGQYEMLFLDGILKSVIES